MLHHLTAPSGSLWSRQSHQLWQLLSFVWRKKIFFYERFKDFFGWFIWSWNKLSEFISQKRSTTLSQACANFIFTKQNCLYFLFHYMIYDLKMFIYTKTLKQMQFSIQTRNICWNRTFFFFSSVFWVETSANSIPLLRTFQIPQAGRSQQPLPPQRFTPSTAGALLYFLSCFAAILELQESYHSTRLYMGSHFWENCF